MLSSILRVSRAVLEVNPYLYSTLHRVYSFECIDFICILLFNLVVGLSILSYYLYLLHFNDQNPFYLRGSVQADICFLTNSTTNVTENCFIDQLFTFAFFTKYGFLTIFTSKQIYIALQTLSISNLSFYFNFVCSVSIYFQVVKFMPVISYDKFYSYYLIIFHSFIEELLKESFGHKFFASFELYITIFKYMPMETGYLVILKLCKYLIIRLCAFYMHVYISNFSREERLFYHVVYNLFALFLFPKGFAMIVTNLNKTQKKLYKKQLSNLYSTEREEDIPKNPNKKGFNNHRWLLEEAIYHSVEEKSDYAKYLKKQFEYKHKEKLSDRSHKEKYQMNCKCSRDLTKDQYIRMMSFIINCYSGRSWSTYLTAFHLYVSGSHVDVDNLLKLIKHVFTMVLRYVNLPQSETLDHLFQFCFGEDFSKITDTKVLKDLRDSLTFAAAAPIAAVLGLSVKFEAFQLWSSEHLYHMKEIGQSFDLVKNILNFLETGLEYFISGNVNVWFKKERWLKWHHSVMFILNNYTNEEEMYKHKYIDERGVYSESCLLLIRSLIEESTEIIAALQTSKQTYNLGQVMSAVNALSSLESKLIAASYACEMRKAAFAVAVIGDPGIGKSDVMSVIISVTGNALGLKVVPSNIVSLNEEDKFLSNLHHQQIVRVPDLVTKQPEFKNNMLNPLSLIDASPLQLNKAELQEKGRIYSNIELFVAGSNFIDLGFKDTMMSVSANLRRFIHVFCKVKGTNVAATSVEAKNHLWQENLMYAVATVRATSSSTWCYNFYDAQAVAHKDVCISVFPSDACILNGHEMIGVLRKLALKHKNKEEALKHNRVDLLDRGFWCNIHNDFGYNCTCASPSYVTSLPVVNTTSLFEDLSLNIFKDREKEKHQIFYYSPTVSYYYSKVIDKLSDPLSLRPLVNEIQQSRLTMQMLSDAYLQAGLDAIINLNQNLEFFNVNCVNLANAILDAPYRLKQYFTDKLPVAPYLLGFGLLGYTAYRLDKSMRSVDSEINSYKADKDNNKLLYEIIRNQQEQFAESNQVKFATITDIQANVDVNNLVLSLRPIGEDPPPVKNPTTRQNNIAAPWIRKFDPNQLESLVHKFQDNIYFMQHTKVDPNTRKELHIDPGTSPKFICLNIDANVFIANKHAFLELWNGLDMLPTYPVKLFNYKSHSPVHEINNAGVYFIASKHIKVIGKDIVMFHILCRNRGPNLLKYITLDDKPSPGKCVLITPDRFEYNTCVWDNIRNQYTYRTGLAINGNSGMIGLLYTDNIIKIFVHSSGYEGMQGFGEHFSKIEKYQCGFSFDDILNPLNKSYEVLPLSERSIFRHCNDNVYVGEVIGTIPDYQVSTPKSQLEYLPLYDYLKPNLTIPTLGAFQKNDEWVSPHLTKIKKLLTPPVEINPLIARWAIDDWKNSIRRHIPPDIAPRNLMDVINAIDGRKSIRLDTSAGPTLKGKKTDYIVSNGDGVKMFSKEIIEQIVYMDKCARDNINPIVWVGMHPKDEPISREKMEKGKVRIFSADMMAKVVYDNIYTGPFFEALLNARSKIPSSIGVNAASIEWAEKLSYLIGNPDDLKSWDSQTFNNDKSFLNLDGKDWDVYHALLIWANVAVIELLMEFKNYQDKEHCLRCVMETNIQYGNLCLGDLFVLFNKPASGRYCTAEWNTIAMELAWRIVFAIIFPKIAFPSTLCKDYGNDPDKSEVHLKFDSLLKSLPNSSYDNKGYSIFSAYMRQIVYGDDNITHPCDYIIRGINRDPTCFVQAFTLIGIPVTAGNKLDKIEFESINTLTFLKRGFHAEDLLILCPLDEKSIIKSLCFYSKDTPLTKRDYIKTVLMQAAYQYFMYGSTVYNQKIIELYLYVDYLNKFPEYSGLDIIFPPWSSIKDDYLEGSYRDYDLTL